MDILNLFNQVVDKKEVHWVNITQASNYYRLFQLKRQNNQLKALSYPIDKTGERKLIMYEGIVEDDDYFDGEEQTKSQEYEISAWRKVDEEELRPQLQTLVQDKKSLEKILQKISPILLDYVELQIPYGNNVPLGTLTLTSMHINQNNTLSAIGTLNKNSLSKNRLTIDAIPEDFVKDYFEGHIDRFRKIRHYNEFISDEIEQCHILEPKFIEQLLENKENITLEY